MTTTLRPVEEEHREPGGGRSRRYAVCVNSRPVGEIRIAAKPWGRTLAGELSGLRIDERDRHRGRGTVAALAAEEVLRQWGCARVVALVPGDSPQGRRLAEALAYQEQGRFLDKPVSGAVALPLPEGCAVRPVTREEYPHWLERQRPDLVRLLVDAGMPEGDALSYTQQQYDSLLPEGAATARTVLRTLTCRGEDVGTLWLALRGPADTGQAWVYWVRVEQAHRGRGHGRTLLRLAEAECAAAGVPRIGLHGCADAPVALRLYESMGYQPTSHRYVKPLL